MQYFFYTSIFLFFFDSNSSPEQTSQKEIEKIRSLIEQNNLLQATKTYIKEIPQLPGEIKKEFFTSSHNSYKAGNILPKHCISFYEALLRESEKNPELQEHISKKVLPDEVFLKHFFTKDNFYKLSQEDLFTIKSEYIKKFIDLRETEQRLPFFTNRAILYRLWYFFYAGVIRENYKDIPCKVTKVELWSNFFYLLFKFANNQSNTPYFNNETIFFLNTYLPDLQQNTLFCDYFTTFLFTSGKKNSEIELIKEIKKSDYYFLYRCQECSLSFILALLGKVTDLEQTEEKKLHIIQTILRYHGSWLYEKSNTIEEIFFNLICHSILKKKFALLEDTLPYKINRNIIKNLRSGTLSEIICNLLYELKDDIFLSISLGNIYENWVIKDFIETYLSLFKSKIIVVGETKNIISILEQCNNQCHNFISESFYSKDEDCRYFIFDRNPCELCKKNLPTNKERLKATYTSVTTTLAILLLIKSTFLPNTKDIYTLYKEILIEKEQRENFSSIAKNFTEYTKIPKENFLTLQEILQKIQESHPDISLTSLQEIIKTIITTYDKKTLSQSQKDTYSEVSWDFYP
jgi:hypothetical protein